MHRTKLYIEAAASLYGLALYMDSVSEATRAYHRKVYTVRRAEYFTTATTLVRFGVPAWTPAGYAENVLYIVAVEACLPDGQ